jgi:hypothetical protein
MESDLKLTAYNIYELGKVISEKLRADGVYSSGNTLSITVDKESFSKIDEDLFYRLNENKDGNEFVPSDNVIIVKFDNLTMNIRKSTE